jgi:hypothetical protein
VHQNLTAIDDDKATAEEKETGISGPPDQRDFDCASTQIVTITRLSKEKDINLQKAIKMHILRKEKLGDLGSESSKVDLDEEEERVIKEKATEQVKQDNMARQITKPFQYYLFDPLSESTKFFDGDKPVSRQAVERGKEGVRRIKTSLFLPPTASTPQTCNAAQQKVRHTKKQMEINQMGDYTRRNPVRTHNSK